MEGIKIMPAEDVARMFARLSELTLDVSGIRRKFLNCPYGEDPKQLLDIYLPGEGDGPFPVVFFAHGGGWAGGSKHDNQVVPFIAGLARGFAIVSIGYRLTPHIKYPENLFDINLALGWIAENAETYLLDRTRTALCGASAGAHLAMMAAFTHGIPAFSAPGGGKTCDVLAVVEQFGPSDFARIHAHYDQSGYARAEPPDLPEPSASEILLGARLREIPNLLRFFNPIDNVHPGMPPVLLQHGRYDPIIPYQQAVELYGRINAVCGEGHAELDLYEDYLHADPGFAGEESVNRIFGFLEKHLCK